MDTGKFTDFYGRPVHHARELPDMGGRRYIESHYAEVPIDGWVAGMSLVSFQPRGDPDPVVLYDRWGKIVKEWPEGYIPNMEEVRQAVQEELKKEGRRA